jgi:hypothetical protein
MGLSLCSLSRSSQHRYGGISQIGRDRRRRRRVVVRAGDRDSTGTGRTCGGLGSSTDTVDEAEAMKKREEAFRFSQISGAASMN